MGRKSLKKIRQKEILKAYYAVAKREGFENTSIAKVEAPAQPIISLRVSVINLFRKIQSSNSISFNQDIKLSCQLPTPSPLPIPESNPCCPFE